MAGWGIIINFIQSKNKNFDRVSISFDTVRINSNLKLGTDSLMLEVRSWILMSRNLEINPDLIGIKNSSSRKSHF